MMGKIANFIVVTLSILVNAGFRLPNELTDWAD